MSFGMWEVTKKSNRKRLRWHMVPSWLPDGHHDDPLLITVGIHVWILFLLSHKHCTPLGTPLGSSQCGSH